MRLHSFQEVTTSIRVNPVPHEDNDEDHGAAKAYHDVIDRMFETRKAIKSAKTDVQFLGVDHVDSVIHKDLALLRELVSDKSNLDPALFDTSLEDATTAEKLIDERAHDGNPEVIRLFIALFDKSILAIEELVNHPVDPGTGEVAEGCQVHDG